MRWSNNPYPRRTKEEDQLWVKTQKAKRSTRSFVKTAFSSRAHSNSGLGFLVPFILVFAVIACVPIYLFWIYKQAKTYPSSRSAFLKQEYFRILWIGAIGMILYALFDIFVQHSHVYASAFAVMFGIFITKFASKRFRASFKFYTNENKKWESRRRRKLAKQEARAQKISA